MYLKAGVNPILELTETFYLHTETQSNTPPYNTVS